PACRYDADRVRARRFLALMSRRTRMVSGIVLLLSVSALGPFRVVSAPVAGYQEVRDWLKLPSGVQLGEAAGVAVDMNGHVFIFHRPGRGFDTAATAKLTDPPVLEVDADTGTLIHSWGADTFLVPHG